MRAVSPLAEGTDRIFAEQALALGFELCAVLPFPQAEFETDFAPDPALEDDSLSRFRGLVAKATIAVRARRNARGRGRGLWRGGLVVLNQSDLLIVVWDGERHGKRGGTEDTFSEARSRGVTVAWIDAHEPGNWQLLDAATPLPRVAAGQRVVPDGSGSAVGLTKLVREVLELPPDKRIDVRTGLKLFYAESPSLMDIGHLLETLRTDHRRRQKTKGAISHSTISRKRSRRIGRKTNRPRSRPWSTGCGRFTPGQTSSLCSMPTVIEARSRSITCSPLSRSAWHSCRWHCVCADGAWAEIVCILLELVTIFAIHLSRYCQVGTRHWHERWIDYRLTAELVRHLRMVAPLGGRRLLPQMPAHWVTYGQPGRNLDGLVCTRRRALAGAAELRSSTRSTCDDYLKHLEILSSDRSATTKGRCAAAITWRLDCIGRHRLAGTDVVCMLQCTWL